MKRIFFISLTVLTANLIFAQTAEVSRDHNGSKVLKGFFTKQDLITDTAFIWFAKNLQGFTPDQNSVQQLKANKDSINIIAFGGTWCDDTKQIFPQFFATTEAAGFSQDRITMLGVDREKKSTQHLSEAFNITHVPTIIIMKNGKELGRVVEYGTTGMPVKEIGMLLQKASGK